MSKATIDIKISGLEAMKKLVELLADNYARLPPAIQEAIGELYSDERLTWDREYFTGIGVDAGSIKVIADEVEVSRVIAIYPDDSELLVFDSGIKKFKSLQAINTETGETICEVLPGDKQ